MENLLGSFNNLNGYMDINYRVLNANNKRQMVANSYSQNATASIFTTSTLDISNISFGTIMDSLPDSDRRYDYLFQNNPCAMYIWDNKTLQVVDCNNEALLRYGYTRDEFLQLSIAQLQFADDMPKINRIARQAGGTGFVPKQKWRQVTKSGQILYIEISGNLIEYGNRKLSIIQINDLTEKEHVLAQLAESQAKLSTATKIARLGYWQLRADGADRYWSDEVYEIWGLNRETFEVTFESFLNTIHPEDKEAFEREQFAYHNWRKTFDMEYRIMMPDGSVKWVYEKGKLLEDDNGNPVIFQGMVQDISERKVAENELKAFAEELYKRNKELHEFGYIVSHNLRSPIANIMGTTNVLELDKDDPETVDQCIKDLKSSIHRLDAVIRDLSKILSITDGSAALNKENIDITEVLTSIKAEFLRSINLADLKIQIPDKKNILYSHKAYLYSILLNLVSNAIKYRSNESPQIKIEIDQTAQFTIITISDNGIGIDLIKHAGDLFKPYKRFNTELEGKGLGLFLVKSHVEALSGTISIESEPGRGTTFTIVFPTHVKEAKGVNINALSKGSTVKLPGIL